MRQKTAKTNMEIQYYIITLPKTNRTVRPLKQAVPQMEISSSNH